MCKKHIKTTTETVFLNIDEIISLPSPETDQTNFVFKIYHKCEEIGLKVFHIWEGIRVDAVNEIQTTHMSNPSSIL